MSKVNNYIPSIGIMNEVGAGLGKAFGVAIMRHPITALAIGGGLAGLYMLKDKTIKFKLKSPDLDIEFETE